MAQLKYFISPEQGAYIDEHYLLQSDSEMAEELKIRPYYINQYRVDKKLYKKGPNELRKFDGVQEEYFNVDAVDNWLS